MDNEKKITLDELPDEGSDPKPEVRPSPVPLKKPPVEPRVESLKKMDHPQRLEALQQRWHFSKAKYRFEWVLGLLVLIILQKTELLLEMAGKELTTPSDGDFINLDTIKELILTMFSYPIGFVIFFPIFFKFRYSSLDHFEITFSGINTIRELDVPGDLAPTRVFVKWGDITRVKKNLAKGRSVLEIFTTEGKVAEMIWDIDDIKKKVIAQILKGLVTAKNPFREFIEKDVT